VAGVSRRRISARRRAGRDAGGATVNTAVRRRRSTPAISTRRRSRGWRYSREAAAWAGERRDAAPDDANAHYLYAFALGRYSQGHFGDKALAQGFGGKIKDALTKALKLAPSDAMRTPRSAPAAEVINKVGGLVAGMTYGAKKDSALEHYQQALKLNPESAISRIEYANGLIMLFDKARLDDATKLYEQAARCAPMDAMERLDVELARSELA
jgi:tetratricopeptide (TPR) repeat protein